MNDVGQQRERRATAERTHQGERKKIGRKMERRENRSEQTSQQVNSARAFEHADADQHRDQERNDFQDHAEPFLRTFDEFLVDLDPARGGVDRKKAQ